MGHESLSSWALGQLEKVSEEADKKEDFRHAGKKTLLAQHLLNSLRFWSRQWGVP